MAYASLERQLSSAQTSKLELEKRLRDKELQIEKLERDRRWLADREQEEREEKERERVDFQEQLTGKDGELRTLRFSLTALREELAELQDTHTSLSRSTSQTIASQKSQITTLSRQATVLEAEVGQFKLLAEERSQTIDEIQGQLNELSQNNIIPVNSDSDDMAIVRQELHRQAEYLRKLEATNAKLSAEVALWRDRHTSIEVLREEKRSLERKLQPMEGLREQVARLEAQLEAAKQERAPEKIPTASETSALSILRLQHARLLEDHGVTTAHLRAKETELKDAEHRVTEAQTAIERLEADVSLLKDTTRRAEQQVRLAEREVGFMKALLSSYSLEETNKEGHSIDTVRAEQVQHLEALLAEYKTANTALSQQLNEIGEREPAAETLARQQELETEQALRAEAEKALETITAEMQTHLDKIEELEQELFDLSGEIAGGRHVPPGIRILSFKDTPDLPLRDSPMARQAELERVQKENAALLQQIETSGTASQGSIPNESWVAVCKERDELTSEVKQKEKRLKRLQEIFAAKAHEFRESIASLLGVKLAFFQNGQVRVTSLYDESATFVFKPAEGASSSGNMQLIAQGEGGPEDLPNMMQYWVGTEQCIPGFLSSVTLELYDRWKKEHP
ncbi:unnamed protein product [Mycena citricolor]|nr:unnamed protein product [Mycena citricolor]